MTPRSSLAAPMRASRPARRRDHTEWMAALNETQGHTATGQDAAGTQPGHGRDTAGTWRDGRDAEDAGHEDVAEGDPGPDAAGT